MKTFFVLCALLVSQFSFAAATQITASGGSPIPTAYSAANSQSRVMECVGNAVVILNQSSTVLAVAFGSSSTAPSSDLFFVPAGPGGGRDYFPPGGLSKGVYLYIRSVSGSTITSGTVQVDCNYEDKK